MKYVCVCVLVWKYERDLDRYKQKIRDESDKEMDLSSVRQGAFFNL